jgi:membrane protein
MTDKAPDRASAVSTVGSFLRTLFAEFQRDQCLTRAAGLAFATLLALVPLSALLFSLFSALGSFSGVLERFQAFLITQLVPTSQEEIMAYIRRFVQNTRALGVVGLLFFLITAVFLLNTVQSSFNAVWGSRVRRSSLHRLATYASVLMVGSLLLSIGLNLTGMVRSILVGPAVAEIGKSLSFLTVILPFVFIFLALLLMIALVPSGRVRGSSALVGAAAGVVLWELARRLFFLWITYVLRLSVVYGSLAVVPIFLIWLYVAWSVVLLALEIAYVHQHRRFAWLGRSPLQVSPGERFLFGLEVFLNIAGRFYRGEGPPSRQEIARHLNASLAEVSYFTDLLQENGLVLLAGPQSAHLLPARSLDRISLQGLFQCLFGSSAQPAYQSEQALALYNAVTGAASDSLADRSVQDFFKLGIAPARHPGEEVARRAGRAGAAGRAQALKRLQKWLRLPLLGRDRR